MKYVFDTVIDRTGSDSLKWDVKEKGDVAQFGHFLRMKTGLFLSPGRIFGEQGESFLRMNIACPGSVLMDGLSRLKNGVEEWKRK